MRFPERVAVLHAAFEVAAIPHAIGGALALAYSVKEPRGTRDIDVNIFLPAERAADVIAALPDDIEIKLDTLQRIERDSQIRLWWDDTPVDLFFAYHAIHEQARRNAMRVPYEGATIDVLGPVELAVFKAVFDRGRDWVDIEEMIRSESLDVDAVRTALGEMFDAGDERFAKLDAAVRDAGTDPDVVVSRVLRPGPDPG